MDDVRAVVVDTAAAVGLCKFSCNMEVSIIIIIKPVDV